MKTPIHILLLWEAVNTGMPGFLAIFEETGYPYVTQGTLGDYINGGLCDDPFSSSIFMHAPQDVFSMWEKSNSFSEFCRKVNVCADASRAQNVKKWADIYGYKRLGDWFTHGLEGVYDFKSARRLDDTHGYYRVSLDMLLSDLSLGAELYQSISEAVGEQNLSNDLIILKPEGSSTQLVGYNQGFLIAVIVPEVYENLVKSVSLTISL